MFMNSKIFCLALTVIVLLSGCSPYKKFAKKIRKEKFDEALVYGKQKIADYEAERNLQNGLSNALPFYMGVGQIYKSQGDYRNAEKTYLRAREVADKITSGSKQITGTKLDLVDELAEIQLESGNYEGAGEMLRGGLEKRHDLYAKRNVLRYRSNLYYGQYLMARGKYDEAYGYLNEYALIIRNKLFNTNSLHDFDRMAEAYEALTRVELQRGNFKEAKYLADKTFKYQDHRWAHRLAGNNNLDRMESYNLMAQVAMQEKDFDKALKYSDEALKLYNNVLKEPTIHKVPTLQVRAVLLWKMNRLEDAYNVFHEANEIQLKFLNENLARLTEYEQANLARQIKENIELFYCFSKAVLEQNTSLTKTILPEIYNVQINTKAKLLEEAHKRIVTLAQNGDPAVKEKFEHWRSLRDQYARLITVSAGEEALQQIDKLNKQIIEIEKTLSLQLSGFATTSSLADWKDIAAKLTRDEVAIETIRIKNPEDANSKRSRYSYLFLAVTNDSALPSFKIINNGDTLENRLFNHYANTIKAKVADTQSCTHYFEPLKELIGTKTAIHFSPDGIYNFINLSILTNNGVDYIGDKYRIVNHTNTKYIKKSGNAKMVYATATLFGRPRYGDERLLSVESINNQDTDKTNRAIVSLDADIPDLPGTELEVKAIEKLLSKRLEMSMYIHDEASEEAIKKSTSTDILHIATHGFFISEANTDPMLTSGLLFSGVTKKNNQRADDGILTAYEAAFLNLSNTNLAVLSACETGLGEIRNGEGVYGLQRAFEIAGVRNILMSLWKIDDAATVALMEEFYKGLLESHNANTALKKAQDKMRQSPKYEHPYYWGAFKLVGD
jgi:CHAT domain-containing protein/tetratricopeptide (TPR) repeat protein